jgi:tetratricopeptide (TPR) repeat protein
MRFLLIAALALLAGCETVPEAPPAAPPAGPTETAPSAQAEAPPPPPIARSENTAVAGLMETARADAAAGKLSTAAASLERALRIEPRNPRLWQELARVRLHQRQFMQAESVAARSNSFAGSDNALRADNWRLIAQSREARGDEDGARAARESAEKFSR